MTATSVKLIKDSEGFSPRSFEIVKSTQKFWLPINFEMPVKTATTKPANKEIIPVLVNIFRLPLFLVWTFFSGILYSGKNLEVK